MSEPVIQSVHALEVLDSRGNPTIGVTVTLSDGTVASAMVPSGASTGTHEAVELRDGDPARYHGKGVRKAVGHVEAEIAPAVVGLAATDQIMLDRRLIDLDGTANKARLGANAILGVSCAVARAAASATRQPLWRYLAGARTPRLPVPMVNIFSGGLHAGRQIEFQDFLVVPHGLPSYSRALEAVVAIHRSAHEVLEARGFPVSGVADEGGWGPRLASNELAVELLTEAIRHAGFAPGRDVSIALDVAASHFRRAGHYHLQSEDRTLSSEQMVGLFHHYASRYPVISIEDGLEEDDWAGWKQLTIELASRIQLIGDDLFTTNLDRLNRGIREGVANAVLVKMNQIGTLTETFAVIDRAREAGYRAVISARSGETEDSFLADLAVASGAGQIKVGSVTRSERLSKYNRLLEIERDAGLPFDGNSIFKPF
jgi:enolase